MAKQSRIVLTGGPCAGKTTVVEALEKTFPGNIIVMPEIASMLLGHGFPRPGVDIAPSSEWFTSFQKAVLPVQEQMEVQYCQIAAEKQVKIVVFDRGLIDGAAYLPEGVEKYLEMFHLNREAAYQRYDMIIHLETVACFSAALFDELKVTNPARYETSEDAVARDRALREVWKQHPNWHAISGKKGIEKVVADVVGLVKNLLGDA